MEYAALTDRDLFIRTAAGDQQAFARLYTRYARRLTAYLYERCGKDRVLAQDLLQQVFLQLLESKAFASPSEGRERLDSLLYSIAANVLKNNFRSQSRRQRHLDQYSTTLEPAAAFDGLPRLSPALLEQGLQSLSVQQREVVELRFKDGLTIAEIADLLDCSAGTIKSRMHYGLQKMAATLRPKLQSR
ncbi:MAG: RNA polymerase sigma factor [Saprospiraceae bacterium]